MKSFVYILLLFLGSAFFVYPQNKDDNKDTGKKTEEVKRYSKGYFVELGNKNRLFWTYADENLVMMNFLKIAYANFGTVKSGNQEKPVDTETFKKNMRALYNTYLEGLKLGFKFEYDKAIETLKKQREEINKLLGQLVENYKNRVNEIADYAIDVYLQAKSGKLNVEVADYFLNKAREEYRKAMRCIERKKEYDKNYKEGKIDIYDVYYNYDTRKFRRDKSGIVERQIFPNIWKVKVYREKRYILPKYNPDWGYVFAIEHFRRAKEYYFKAIRFSNFPFPEKYRIDAVDDEGDVYRREVCHECF